MKIGSTLITITVLMLLQAIQGSSPLLIAQGLNNKSSEQQYVINRWDNTEGLPVNVVFKTAKDNTGYLWAATEEGLIRFDGVNFKIFDQDIIDGLDSPMIYDLSKSSGGGIWAASAKSILKVDRNQSRIFDASEYVIGTHIQSISEDQNQNLLVGTNNGELFILKEGRFEGIAGWPELKAGGIRTIEKYQYGNLIGTQRGLYYLNSSTGQLNSIAGLEEMEIRAIETDQDGSFWLGTRLQGILKIEGDSITHYNTQNGLHNNHVNSIAIANSGEVWVGFGFGGFQIIDGDDLISIRNIGFEENEVMNIYISESETVWLSVIGIGIVQLILSDIQMLRESDGLSYDITLAIFEDREGVVWSSTPGAGVNRIEGSDITHITPEDGLTHGVVLSIYGIDDYIYFGTPMYLNRYNRSERRIDRIFTPDDGLASEVILGVFQDSGGTVWITTRSGGIHKLIDHHEIVRVEVPPAYEHVDFINIMEDSRGNLWFGTTSAGILKMDIYGEFTGYSIGYGPASEAVLSTYEDPEGSIWIGTNAGLLNLQDDGEFKLFNRENGLQFDGIFRIIEDDHGTIWASGNFGIQRMKVSDLMHLKKAESDSERISVRLFDTSDGLANREVNGGVFPAGWKLQNGDIWFPTMQGIAKIDPDNTSEPDQSLKVDIQLVSFGGQEFETLEGLTIPPGVHNVEINYNSFDFRKPQTINYSFRIVGLQEEWEQVGNRKVIYLTGLNPGSYTFEVIAEQFGTESDVASLDFRMEPMFQQTTIFKLLVLIGLFLGGFFARKLYASKRLGRELSDRVDQQTLELKDRNIKLKRALDDIEYQNMVLKAVAWVQSHELRGPLSRMMGLIEILKNYDQYKEVRKDKSDLIHDIDESANELDGIIRKLNKDLENLEGESS